MAQNVSPRRPEKSPWGSWTAYLNSLNGQTRKTSKKTLSPSPFSLPKSIKKLSKSILKPIKLSIEKNIHFFNVFFIDLTTFFIDFPKQFLIEFPNLEKIPHLTICSKIFEWIEGRGSRFSLKIAIQIYWKSIQKAIQFFNDFSMILEGFRASFWEAKRGQGRPWKQDQKRYGKSKVRLAPGIAKTCLVGFAPL